jgi:hypothetical protein
MDYQQKLLKKAEVEEVNIQLEKGEITIEQANLKAAAFAADVINIESKVAAEQEALKNLVLKKWMVRLNQRIQFKN